MQNPEVQAGQVILITGPARSGKSEWAETLAAQSGHTICYVATAKINPSDGEWQQRLAAHQGRRPPEWITLEVPVAIAQTIRTTPASTLLLVDSLGTWLANLLAQDQPTWEQTRQELLQSLVTASCTVILVAEETGWGVVPAYPLGRTFRDRLGDLVRRIGAIADTVYLVTGGYALNLSLLGIPLPRS